MSTYRRAALDIAADPLSAGRAEIGAPFSRSAAPSDITVIEDAIVVEQTSAPPRREDIAAVRLAALAKRVVERRQSSADDDAALSAADEVIEPVSVARIAEMRRAAALDGTSLGLPTGEAAAASVNASEPPIANLKLQDAPSKNVPESAGVGPSPLPLTSEVIAKSALGRRIAQTNDAVPLIADQSVADIRLVDLIKRQQTLLDRLNRFPPPPELPDEPAPASSPAPAEEPSPAETSVIDRLAPTPMALTFAAEPRSPKSEEPAAKTEQPPVASPSSLSPGEDQARNSGGSPLQERAPIIIERARAERSGRLDPHNAAKLPSTIPAFAAGLALAIAAAGTLFYLL